MHSLILTRRNILVGLGGAALTISAGQVSFARTTGSKKFILVILRGAMDGLAAVAPYADPNYAAARGTLAIAPPGSQDGLLSLSDGFGLHPRLRFLHAEWTAGELAIMHAACSPYRDRSHFDGQDVLENGGSSVFQATDGWLNRALTLLPASSEATGVAIGSSPPLVLKGNAPITSWTPSKEPPVPSSTLARLTDLYSVDPPLSKALASAVETSALLGDTAMPSISGDGGYGVGGYRQLAAAAAKIVSSSGGPSVAVISLEGWDTHANQGAVNGGLALRLSALDSALASLKSGLGATWTDTAVVVATEFGRTVAENGTGGTDHGTGGVAFLLGGSVRGKRFLGDWPTLAPSKLFENRDLAPVNDIRALFAGVLLSQMGLDIADLRRRVFPDSSGMTPIGGLMK